MLNTVQYIVQTQARSNLDHSHIILARARGGGEYHTGTHAHDQGQSSMCQDHDHRYYRHTYPGLETAHAAHRMLGNRKQLISVILVINGRLAK